MKNHDEGFNPARRSMLRTGIAAAVVGAVATSGLLKLAPVAAQEVKKAAKTTAMYQPTPHGKDQCDNCIHYIAGKTPTAEGTCKIVEGKIPSKKLFEDEDILAFHDIQPVAPVHFMLIPKLHIDSLAQVEQAHQMLLGKMMLLASRLALEQGCGDGWRTIINTGRVGRQEVYHLHMHVIGGKDVLPGMIKR